MTPIERAASIIAAARAESARLSPRDAARLAHHAGGPGVDELERRILARRTRTT